jgi:hypothetical protein
VQENYAVKTVSEGDSPPPSVGENQEAELVENPFESFVGALPAFATLDEINAWVRDLRADDPPPDLSKD